MHSMRSVQRDGDALVVIVRSAPAATDLAMVSTYRWTGVQDGGVRLQWSVEPEGEWTVPLPRLGLRLELPAAISDVTWFGLGPGEAYADSTQAARVGRWSRTVDELQTPYVFPQENGNRREVRWAELRTMGGAGLRICVTADVRPDRAPLDQRGPRGGPAHVRPRPATPCSSTWTWRRTGWAPPRAGPACCRSTS